MFSRIVVPIDAFAEDPRLVSDRLPQLLGNLIASPSARVDAVYVMTPKGTRVPLKEFPQWQDFYKKAATGILAQSLGHLAEKANVQYHVLPRGDRSRREAVSTLLEYAKRENADLLALTTHGRKRVDRFFLGSFAEACILQSEIPVLVLNPRVACDTSFRRILYPTDLRETSSATLKKVTALAQALKARVILYHIEEPLYDLLPPPGFIVEKSLEGQVLEDKGRLRDLKACLETSGVEVDIKMGLQSSDRAETIAEAAKELGASLIAMETRSTKVGPFLLGSTSRQVIRFAECPVIVFPERVAD